MYGEFLVFPSIKINFLIKRYKNGESHRKTLKKNQQKFVVLKNIPTFAIPKIKQPLAQGEKNRNVAIKFNLI